MNQGFSCLAKYILPLKLYGKLSLAYIPPDVEDARMSERERISWVELITKLVAGTLYFGHILSLPAGADLLDPHTARIAMWFIGPIIVVSIVCGALMRVVQKRTGGGSDAAQHDERDSLINLRATRIAFGVFTVAVGAVWMLIMLIERERSYRGEPATVLELLSTGPLQVMHVAQLLLLSGLLASITLNASRIFYYRRGY